MMTSLSDLELVVLDLELRDHADNIETMEQMAQLAREEIYRRISQDEQVEILKFFLPALKARPDSILSNEKAFLPQGPKGILQDFLSVNDGNITALVPTPKHLQGLIGATQSIDTSIKILQKVIDRRESADEFFAVFEAIAWRSPSDEYRNALNEFFKDNADTLEKFPFSPEQVKHIERHVKRVSTGIVLLKGGLQQATGDADQFFAIFKAVTSFDSNDKYADALNEFFKDNADTLEKFPLSPEQVKHIERYVKRISTGIVLLKGGLQQAKGDADQFFAIFKAVTSFDSNDKYKDALNKFLKDNADTLEKFPLSPEQVKHIERYVKRISTGIVLLKGGLQQAKGDADQFFAIFEAVTNFNSNDKYKDALSKFFTDNAETIMNLELSFDQIQYLNHYINRYSTSLKILELVLRKTEYAGDFFNIFHAITARSSKKSKHLYGNFLTDHAKAIVDLNPSPDQMGKISKYLSSPEILFDMAKNQKKKQKVCAASVAILLSLNNLPENTESKI